LKCFYCRNFALTKSRHFSRAVVFRIICSEDRGRRFGKVQIDRICRPWRLR
jgi:hypothetical protein